MKLVKNLRSDIMDKLNSFDEYKRRQKMLHMLDTTYNRDINKFKDAVNNTDLHELVKYMKYRDLRKAGHDVVAEARFAYGRGRADIFDITEGIAYEVVMTEKEESILRKKQRYPVPIEVVYVEEYLKTNKFLHKITWQYRL